MTRAAWESPPDSAFSGPALDRTVCVLIRRLNSSCKRSIAFDVRIDFHWLGCVLLPQRRTLRRYPFRQMRPEIPQRRLLDRRYLLLVKLSLDTN